MSEEKPEKRPKGRPKGSTDKTPRKKRGDSAFTKLHNPELPDGYNARLTSFLMEIAPTEPLNRHDVDEMRRRFQHYLETCKKYDMKIANLQAYQAMGLNKDEVTHFITQRSANPERADFLKYVRGMCGAYREALANDGKIRDSIAIFYGKNYDGLKDQQEVVINANAYDDTVSAEELAKKYLETADMEGAKTIETTAQDSVPLQISETETETT